MGAQGIKDMADVQEWTGGIAGSRSRGMAEQAWITLPVGRRAETESDLVKAVDRHA
jgi:hypothetical protein